MVTEILLPCNNLGLENELWYKSVNSHSEFETVIVFVPAKYKSLTDVISTIGVIISNTRCHLDTTFEILGGSHIASLFPTSFQIIYTKYRSGLNKSYLFTNWGF